MEFGWMIQLITRCNPERVVETGTYTLYEYRDMYEGTGDKKSTII